MVIQIVEQPYLFPQRCFFTGNALPQPIIDTGVNDTEGGRVYISLSFMDDLAAAAGYSTREESARLLAENELLQAKLNRLPDILGDLTDGVRTLAADAELDLLRIVADSGVLVPEDDEPAVAGEPGTEPAAEPAARQ